MPTPLPERLGTWLSGWRAALLVFVAALGVRFAYAVANPPVLAGDAGEYRAYAQSLLERHRYEGPRGERASRSPGYPVFLAGVAAVAGPCPYIARSVQCWLGALTCLLCLRLAALLLPAPWPVLCGLAAAFYYGLYAASALLLSECLYSLLLAWAFLELYKATSPDSGQGLRGALLCGLAFWAASMVRPEGLVLGVVAWAAVPAAFSPGTTRRKALLALLVLALGTSLWAGRNWAVLGRPVIGTTRSGQNRYAAVQMPLGHRGIIPEAPFEPQAGLGELERDAAFAGEDRRLRAGLGTLRVLEAYAFDFFTHFYPFLPQYDWTYVFLLPFWAFGVFLSLRRRPELRPMAAAVLASAALYTLWGGPASRYRQAYAPLLVVLACAGAEELQGSPRARGAALGWGGLNAAVWLFAEQLRRVALLFRDVLFR